MLVGSVTEVGYVGVWQLSNLHQYEKQG